MAKAVSISLRMSNERVSVTYCSLAKLFNLINSLLVKINFALKKSMLSIAVLRKKISRSQGNCNLYKFFKI